VTLLLAVLRGECQKSLQNEAGSGTIRVNSGLIIEVSHFLNWENRMNIRPLQDRVVVRRLEEETKSAGGIVIPGSAAEKPSQGEVLAVGTGKKLDNGSVQAVDLNVGDKVLFGQYAGSTVKVDGEELLVMSESEVFGVIE
jgi:chaperonin GroES